MLLCHCLTSILPTLSVLVQSDAMLALLYQSSNAQLISYGQTAHIRAFAVYTYGLCDIIALALFGHWFWVKKQFSAKLPKLTNFADIKASVRFLPD